MHKPNRNCFVTLPDDVITTHMLMALQSVCSESASFDLPAGVLASCVQEVQSALEIALVRREDGAAQRGGEIFVAGAGTCSQLHV